MTDPIQTICNLTACSNEDAERVYKETNNVIDAVDRLLVKNEQPSDKYVNKVRYRKELTNQEEEIAQVRNLMKENDERMYQSKRDQPEPEKLNETPSLHEETVLQNNYSLQYQLPSLE